MRLTRAFLDERLVPELEAETIQYFDHIRRYLFAQEFVAGKTVLDIACGTGYGSEMLRRGGARHVLSCDLSAAALAYAASMRDSLTMAQADALALPLRAGSLEVVVSFETLEHLTDAARFLDEVRRVLIPAGIFILSTPNRLVASPGSDTPYSPYHAFEPTAPELRALLSNSGWKITAFYCMMRSERAARLAVPQTAPFAQQDDQPANIAYLRKFVRDLLPPILTRWHSRRRGIPQFDLADAILMREVREDAAYFVVVCSP